jgi:hypothetical protein
MKHNRTEVHYTKFITGTKVYLQSCPKENKFRMVSNDEKWTYVGCEFKEIDMNKIEGRNKLILEAVVFYVYLQGNGLKDSTVFVNGQF